MKQIAIIAALLALAGCANQQTEATAEEAVVTTESATEQSELLQLWQRHCAREALSVEEMQEIANSEMPAELTGQCFSK